MNTWKNYKPLGNVRKEIVIKKKDLEAKFKHFSIWLREFPKRDYREKNERKVVFLEKVKKPIKCPTLLI